MTRESSFGMMDGPEKSGIDWVRLDQFVRGAGDATERASLAAWVNATPERRALADAMRAVGRSSSARRYWDARTALAKVWRRAEIPEMEKTRR